MEVQQQRENQNGQQLQTKLQQMQQQEQNEIMQLQAGQQTLRQNIEQVRDSLSSTMPVANMVDIVKLEQFQQGLRQLLHSEFQVRDNRWQLQQVALDLVSQKNQSLEEQISALQQEVQGLHARLTQGTGAGKRSIVVS